ncbi:hypothetical protein LNQ03_09100 [Klebsiella pneumoniae subsp. pneumoniae]|nr:hypothetical protein [Klebsiella pneumoniae subsp. pneumoniae]
MTRYSATLSQQAGSGSLSFNGIWSEDVRHHRWRSYQLGYANRHGQLNYYLYAQQSAGYSSPAIIRWWASPLFAAVRAGGQPDYPL